VASLVNVFEAAIWPEVKISVHDKISNGNLGREKVWYEELSITTRLIAFGF